MADNFGWYELMTSDTKAAGEFYSSVIGWTTAAVGNPEQPYFTFNVNGVGLAGMLEWTQGPPAWIGYIHVPDVDAYVERVTEAGGSVHKPATDVPGMLRFAVVADPDGAAFVLFTSNPQMPTPERPAVGSVGTFGWRELMAADGGAAFAFYSELFGWTKGATHDMGAMGTYQLFDVDGVETGGMMTKPLSMPMPFWSYYIHVDSVTAAVARITAGGGTISNGPMQVPGGSWVVQAVDPQGGHFCVLSMVN